VKGKAAKKGKKEEGKKEELAKKGKKEKGSSNAALSGDGDGDGDDGEDSYDSADEEGGEDKAETQGKVLTKEDVQRRLNVLRALRQRSGLPTNAYRASACPIGRAKLEKSLDLLPSIDTVDMAAWGEDRVLPPKKFPKLSAEGLALAAQFVQSAKSRRDMINAGWNRYMRGDEDRPAFLAEDEDKHWRATNLTGLVTREEVQVQDVRQRKITNRNIKKILEVKARKMRRHKKAMANVNKKVEAMQGSSSMSERDKQLEVAKSYKKALNVFKKKDTKYVVMSKRDKGKAPKGMKGPRKLVDPRMKKDINAKIKLMKKKKTFGRKKK